MIICSTRATKLFPFATEKNISMGVLPSGQRELTGLLLYAASTLLASLSLVASKFLSGYAGRPGPATVTVRLPSMPAAHAIGGAS